MLVKPYVNCDATQDPIPSWMLEERYEYCEDAEMTGKRRHLPILLAMVLGIFA